MACRPKQVSHPVAPFQPCNHSGSVPFPRPSANSRTHIERALVRILHLHHIGGQPEVDFGEKSKVGTKVSFEK